MRRINLAALAAGGLMLAACGGDDGGPGGSAGGNVTLDNQSAVHDSVTVVGKVLTATSHGVTYTLTIPAGAVQVPTVITMTPVTGIERLGVTQFIGAVDLEPQGLVLGKAATLRIVAPHPAPSGTVLLGFGYEGDGDSLAVHLPVDSAGGINLSINHFSGGGAAFATLGQIQTFAPRRPLTTEDGFYTDSLFELTLLDPRDFLAEQNLMRAWFTAVVLPALQNAGNDVALLAAMSRFDFWRAVQTPANLISDDPLFANERAQFAQTALPRLQQAISQNNAVCLADRDLSFANNVLYWQTVADDLGLGSVANGLDRVGVLAGLCLHVLITDSSYPDPVQPQQTASLDLLAGVQYGGQPALDPGLFAWRLDITGSSADGTVQSLSAADGSFTHVIAPTGQGSLVVAFAACLHAPEVPYADVCAAGNLVRNFGGCARVQQGDLTINGPGDLPLAADVREITGDLILGSGLGAVNLPCLHKIGRSLVLTQGAQWNSPGILQLGALDTVLGSISVFAVRGFQDLQVSALRQVLGDIGIGSNPDLQLLVLPDLAVRNVSIGDNHAPAISLGHLKAERLDIVDSPQLTSLDIAGLSGNDRSTALVLIRNGSLSHLSVGSFGPGGLILRGNSLLGLGGIPSSAQVAGFDFDLANGFTEQQALDFANLVGVTAAVCQDDVTTGARIKCYDGPPWH